MAQTCIRLGKECGGCMDCQKEDTANIISKSCPKCEAELQEDDKIFVSERSGDIIACEHCAYETTNTN